MARTTDSRQEEILRATLALVAERGYDRVTMDQIAKTTRSSKATLYRRWGSKGQLVAAAISATARRDPESPDTGNLASDLHEVIRRRFDADTCAAGPDLISSLLPAIRTDPDVASAFGTYISYDILRDLSAAMDRAVDRGEIPSPLASVEQLGTAFLAPIALHRMMHNAEVQRQDLLAYVDAVILPALAAGRAGSAARLLHDPPPNHSVEAVGSNSFADSTTRPSAGSHRLVVGTSRFVAVVGTAEPDAH